LGFASGGESEGEEDTVFAFGGESEGEDGRREWVSGHSNSSIVGISVYISDLLPGPSSCVAREARAKEEQKIEGEPSSSSCIAREAPVKEEQKIKERRRAKGREDALFWLRGWGGFEEGVIPMKKEQMHHHDSSKP
jgi:hypothetical protein